MIRIHCQTHRQNPIAHIDRDIDESLYVYTYVPPPTYTVEPEPLKRQKQKLQLLEGRMPLEGPWVKGRWQGIDAIETWCHRCHGYHLLPFEWLTENMHSERDLHCPCPVLRSSP
jgi:hypothetical protein